MKLEKRLALKRAFNHLSKCKSKKSLSWDEMYASGADWKIALFYDHVLRSDQIVRNYCKVSSKTIEDGVESWELVDALINCDVSGDFNTRCKKTYVSTDDGRLYMTSKLNRDKEYKRLNRGHVLITYLE